jgi:hypothetical protein
VIGEVTRSRRTSVSSDAAVILRTVAIAGLMGAQAIHVRAMIDHARLWPAAGVFFFVIAVLEGVAAAWLLLSPGRDAARFAVVLSFATIAVWGLSRTVGLPIGPHPWIAEPWSTPDVIATGFETMTAVALVSWLRRSESDLPVSTTSLTISAAVVGLTIVLTWIALSAPAHLTGPGF